VFKDRLLWRDFRVLTLFKVAKGLNMPFTELIGDAMKPR
jgi:hypothetical protein